MNPAKKFISVEFHCHTIYSHDSSSQPAALVEAARARGIDKLAITDHNSIRGALKAQALAPEMIIVGEEVLTLRGELIAYFVKEEVPKKLTVHETLKRFKEQGAFISIPHPFDLLRHGWRREELLELLPEVDAIEGFNARCLRRAHNAHALAFGREHGVPMLAGSDAHSLVELGLALTRLPDFTNAEELRRAARYAEIDGRMLSVGDHFKASVQIGWGKLFPRGKK